MDNETNPNENESDVIETSDTINENGCDDDPNDETATVAECKKDENQLDESDANKNDEDDGDVTKVSPEETVGGHTENEPTESEVETTAEVTDQPIHEPIEQATEEPVDETVDEPANEQPSQSASSETEQYTVIDSDNLSESSPEKGSNAACIVSPSSELDGDESCNDKSWAQMNDSNPDKSLSEDAIILSPSGAECDDLINEKGWGQLNESIVDGISDDSMEEEAEDSEDDFLDRNDQKELKRKPAADPEVFELTDDNSSADEAQSDGEDDEMGEEDDESGKFHFFYVRISYTFENHIPC